MSAPSMAAAWSNGAIRAWARSVQWDPSPWAGPRPWEPDPTSTSDLAIVRAGSHSVHDWSGDQRNGRSRADRATDSVGSKRKHSPTRDRASTVASRTSGLVEVETTEPLLDTTLGMINDDVFPERGGPRIITDCSGRTKHQPCSLCPRYTPCPASADASSTLRNSGETGCWGVVGKISFVMPNVSQSARATPTREGGRSLPRLQRLGHRVE